MMVILVQKTDGKFTNCSVFFKVVRYARKPVIFTFCANLLKYRKFAGNAGGIHLWTESDQCTFYDAQLMMWFALKARKLIEEPETAYM